MMNNYCFLMRSGILMLLITLLSFSCESNDCCVTPPDNCQFGVCESELLPVIMIHGFLGSGDTYTSQVQRFIANGYPPYLLHVYDWNSITGGSTVTGFLNNYIDNILQETGKPQVNLVGHSAGGGQCYTFLEDSLRASKVANYVHIGSFANDAPAGPEGMPVPTLNLWSPDDLVVAGADIPGATNASIDGQDHYQIATSPESFDEIFEFFNGITPQVRTIPTLNEVSISGRVLDFGDNSPAQNARIDIYEVDPNTGNRLNQNPTETCTVDREGRWENVNLSSLKSYEFYISHPTDASFRPIHYYKERITFDNPNVYFRSFPPSTSTAGFFLRNLPKDDNQAVVVVFESSQAVISGRDELFLDDIELSNEALASADQTSIAFFVYDEGNDGVSSEEKLADFAMFPFLNGLDYYIQTSAPQTISVRLNERTVNVPNWKSESEGVVVVILD